MEPNLKNGGMLPSAIALKDSLSQKPAISSGLEMLTASQLDLLRLSQIEIDERVNNSVRLAALLSRLRTPSTNGNLQKA